ncbi:MAG TPA: hypothetical protein VMR76_01400 [Candidatus Saccharimonadia bacterium]|nr:hypothetical protein [Candidatus Saccharimonadia bacterium]
MSKIYAPLGYVINHDGKDYYDTTIREDLLAGALGLAEWPDDIRKKIEASSDKELIDIFLDNGFELVEQE